MEKFSNALILDDEPDMAEFIADALELVGYNVRITMKADEFIQFAELEPPMLIVLDLMIPGTDGIELIRSLADISITAGIILISGVDKKVLSSAVSLAREHGLNIIGSLSKPFSVSDLEKVLQNHKMKSGEPEVIDEAFHIQEIKHGISNHEFLPYFQPQIDLKTGNIVGMEVLARWVSLDGKIIGPDQFIPLLEKNDMIGSLSDKIFDLALENFKNFRIIHPNLKLSLNVSSSCLNDLTLPEKIMAMLKEYDIPASSLVLEITESFLITNIKSSLEILTRLRIRGIEFSIDDFGTGYSSMKHLEIFPFNELKIDKSFVIAYEQNINSMAIVQASIDLAHKMDMTVVAEGVETLVMAEKLKELGCDIGQGYYFSKPKNFADMLSWLQDKKSKEI